MTSRAPAVLALLCLLTRAPLTAASTDFAFTSPGFARTLVADGLDPTTITCAPDGRLFVCEKPGRVRIISAAGGAYSKRQSTPTVIAAVRGARRVVTTALCPNLRTGSTPSSDLAVSQRSRRGT